MALKSHDHPHLLLQEHISQVQQAADFLLSCHSTTIFNQDSRLNSLVKAIILCHDLGKGSQAFQTYIRCPNNYREKPRTKSHTPLSTVLAILWAQQEQWDVLDILSLAQAVAGHHSGFKHLEQLGFFIQLKENVKDPLKKQYVSLNLKELSTITTLDLSNIANDDFETAYDWLFEQQRVEKQLEKLSSESALIFRLKTQFCFSVLLEADKAFLALPSEKYLQKDQKNQSDFSPQQVDHYLKSVPTTPLDDFRAHIQTQLLSNIQQANSKCFTMTLPTGAGKTLLAVRWALMTRQAMHAQTGIFPKIIFALPYLSIADQTEKVIRQVLGIQSAEANTEQLLSSHSISDRSFELDGELQGEKFAEFFINIWRSEVIVTTFDQLLYALFSEKTRYLIRFHHLMDAVIVLDEVQTLPIKLWDVINRTLQILAEQGNTKILMMSATQPKFLSPAQELAGTTEQIETVFATCQRYRIHLNHHVCQKIDDFTDHLIGRVTGWLKEKKRVMITLNTRSSAKRVFKRLQEQFNEQVPIHLISADVTPRDRLDKIEAIKAMCDDDTCLVVSTQTVEAGVDIDMDVVIRDLAPLDKLVQIAGRCNRNNKRGQHGGYIEVVKLCSPKNEEYNKMIYDNELITATGEMLGQRPVIDEEEILAISDRYFQLLHRRIVSVGEKWTQRYAYWQEWEQNIRQLLREKQGEQIQFIVLQGDDGQKLRSEIEAALKLDDRWERRRALQNLAGRINERVVSVYDRSGFYPDEYAELVGYFWFLKKGYYTSTEGLDLKLDEEDPAACIL